MVELFDDALDRGDAVTIGTLRILDVDTPIEFLVGANATSEMDEAVLLQGAQEMAVLINGVSWPSEFKAAFEGMRKIVFFTGQVEVNGFLLDRPGCDEDDATFYWKAEEFMRNTEADVRANTFFHDCWHVVQFKESGNKFARWMRSTSRSRSRGSWAATPERSPSWRNSATASPASRPASPRGSRPACATRARRSRPSAGAHFFDVV